MNTRADDKLDEAKKNISDAYANILEVLKEEAEKTNYRDSYIQKLHEAAMKLNALKQNLG